MRNEFKKTIRKLHEENEKLITVVVDSGTGELDMVRTDYPDRLVECGISECNAVGVAAGMAASGCIPVLYGMSPFLVYRAYEFIRDDICLQNLKVVIVGSGAGIIYNNLGPTHHATEDIAVMRSLPNMKILSVASPKETEPIMRCAVQVDGPVYVRFGKAWEEEIYPDKPVFQYGVGQELTSGKDISIISTGSIISNVLKAEKLLREKHYSARCINLSTIKPFDENCIRKAAKETGRILVVEEHSTTGGLASATAEVIARNGLHVLFDSLGFDNRFCKDYGWYQEIKKINGLDEEAVFKKAMQMLQKQGKNTEVKRL